MDPSFGHRGAVVAQLVAGATNVANSIVLQGGGAVVVGGSAIAPNGTGASTVGLVARLRPNGDFDPTFGDRGRVLLPDVGGVIRVLVTGDGHLLVLGARLIRLDRGGHRDARFGSGGSAAMPPSFSPAGIGLAPGGEIVLVGSLQASGRTVAAVARLTADGNADVGFGQGGVVTLAAQTDPQGRPIDTVSLSGVAFAADGSVVVAGLGTSVEPQYGYVTTSDVVARLLPDGTPDPGFGQAGQNVSQIAEFNPNTVRVAGDGRILVGAAQCGGGIALSECAAEIASFTADGQLQPPGNAAVSCQLCSQVGTVAALPGGDLLLSEEGAPNGIQGDSPTANADRLLILIRFDPNLHERYGIGVGETAAVGRGEETGRLPAGSVTEGVTLVQADGRVLVAGSAPTRDGQRGILVARLLGLRAHVSIPRQRARHRNRGVSVRIGCSPSFTCRGEAALLAPAIAATGRSAILGRGRFTIAAGHSARVTIRLTPGGSARLGRQPSARVILEVAPANGSRAVRRLIVSR